jgi:hypothetical protein
MTAHLLDHPLSRPHVAGADYLGRHRGGRVREDFPAGALVVEPGAREPSSVIRHVDDLTVLVRHVGTQDDHPALVATLRSFADGFRVVVGADFGDSY